MMDKVSVEGCLVIVEYEFTAGLIGNLADKLDVTGQVCNLNGSAIGDRAEIGIIKDVARGQIVTGIDLINGSSQNKSSKFADNKSFTPVSPSAGFSIFIPLSEVIEIQSSVVDSNGTAVDQAVGVTM